MKQANLSTAGFTLTELIVALVVSSIFALGTVQLFMMQNQAYMRQSSGVLANQNSRAGFDMLVREARNAGYDPRGLAGAGITKWTADSLAWTADLNADGDVSDTNEAVLFFHDAGTERLMRREGGTDLVIADQVTELDLDYFSDDDGTPAATASQIAQIHIGMQFATPDEVMDGRLETQVAVRNPIY